MKIVKKAVIDAPIQEVWAVIKDEYGNISRWASAVDKSDLQEASAAVGVGTARVCTSTFGTLQETVIALDEGSHALAFEIGGGPKVLSSAQTSFSLTSIDAGHTEIATEAQLGIRAMALPLRPLLRMKFGQGLDNINGDLKEYVETGNAHARKAQRLSQLQAQPAGGASA